MTLLAFAPPVLILAGVAFYGRWRKFHLSTFCAILAALCLCYLHFYFSNWYDYTIDAQSHMQYIDFLLAEHRLPRPEDGMGSAARHPPLFYVTSAALIHLAQVSGITEPIQFARHFSVLCYAVVMLAGVHLLRAVVAEGTAAFFTSLLILLFWPVGITMSGRMTCDLLLYAGQAGTLAALILWQKEKRPERLAPFFWGSIAVLGKNSGLIMIGFAGLALLYTAWLNRRQLRLLLRADLALSMSFAAASAAFSIWHGWIMNHIDQNAYDWPYLWRMVSWFSPFLFLYDNGISLSQDSFWNMWLHSLILGINNIPWKVDDLIILIKVIWMVMLCYETEGLLRYRRRLTPLEKASLRWMAAFTLFMVASALYLLMRTANPHYADARYAYPVFLAFPLIHGIVMQHHAQAGNRSALRIGMGLGGCFALLTVLLFGLQV